MADPRSSTDPGNVAQPNGETTKPRRSTSFNFLRRSKSSEGSAISKTTSAGRKLTRRRKSIKEEAAPLPLRLPSHPDLPSISSSFDPRDPSTYASRSGYPPNAYHNRYLLNKSAPYTMDNGSQPGDIMGRAESMTNRGRYSYASSAISNVGSPRRVRRRKDPTPFNILVVGTKNSGKTSFIEFLRTSLSKPITQRMTSSASPPPPSNTSEQHGSFTSHYLETELEGERVGLTLYDSKGLERHLVDLQLREMTNFIEDKFQETFNEEQKVIRVTGFRDTHIHCVLLVLDPSRLDNNMAASATSSNPQQFSRGAGYKPRVIGGLDEDLDVDVFRKLQGKTTVIPVISKADTITTAHMAVLKRTVWESLKKIKFDPLEAITSDSDNESDYATAYEEDEGDDDDDDSTYSGKANGDSTPTPKGLSKFDTGMSTAKSGTNKLLSPKYDDLKHKEARFSTMSENVDLPNLPFAIISPDVYEPGVIGRRFPWGFADPNNPEHCDFVKMKESVFSEWRGELRQASRERWYEGWRTTRLRRTGQPSSPDGLNTRAHRVTNGSTASAGSPSIRPVNGVGTTGIPKNSGQHRIVNIAEIGVAT